MSNECENRYEWLLETMKKFCFGKYVPISISTDKEQSLVNALQTELPQVKHLLCRWHINKNVLVHIPKVFNGLEKSSVKNILFNWNTLVSSNTEEEYTKNLASLIKNLPKKNSYGTVYDPSPFVTYLKTTWLDDYKEKFLSAWTDDIRHLGTTSSSRIEGAHAILKTHLTTSTGDLNTVFNDMDTILKRQYVDITVQFDRQLYKSNNQFRMPLFNRVLRAITKYALTEAFKKYGKARIDILTTDVKKKLKPCTHTYARFKGIPCAHMIKEKLLEADTGCLDKEDFDEQWWIGREVEATIDASQNEHPFSQESIDDMKEMYDSLPAYERIIVRQLIECIKTGDFPMMLQDPSVVNSKGRPKGAGNRKQHRAISSTQRNSSAFGYTEVEIKKTEAKRKRVAKNHSTANSKKVKQTKQTKTKQTKTKQTTSKQANPEIVVSDDATFGPTAAICLDNDYPDELDYGPILPKIFYFISSKIDRSSYTGIINIKADGYCGFRTLAHRIMDDQEDFFKVKLAMRDKLVDVKESYREIFPNFQIEELEETVLHNIAPTKGDDTILEEKPYKDCDTKYWFLAPECAQLAACTFGRPVCVFYTGSSFTYLPIFIGTGKVKTAPLFLHAVNYGRSARANHYVTLKFKKSIKNTLPMVDPDYSKAMSALKRPNEIMMFWCKYQSFEKPPRDDGNKETGEAIEAESAIVGDVHDGEKRASNPVVAEDICDGEKKEVDPKMIARRTIKVEEEEEEEDVEEDE